MLDEPLSGLDPKARILVKQELTRLHTEGRSIFFSSHMLADVEALSDRMGILSNGVLLFCGSPAECCERYQASDLETAFLNAVNANTMHTEGSGHAHP